MYDKVKVPLHKINHRNLVEGYIKGFGSKVGIYSNHATEIEALKALFQKPEQKPQRDELERRKKLLREVVGAEIDSAKGLAKPKEPAYFTRRITVMESDSDITKAEKYYHNSLVIDKKPYFFRYLYPKVNEKFKAYENSYNEISKCIFGTKFKKLLVKPDKTEQELNLIRRYQKFCPVITSNCTMNILCRQVEAVDFEIQYDKKYVTMLPDFKTEYKVVPEVLKAYKNLYHKYSNKKNISYLKSIYNLDTAAGRNNLKFGLRDLTLEEIKEEWVDLGMGAKESLTYIHALARSYTKFDWSFAWDLLGDIILDYITEDYTEVPVETHDESGALYFGKRYELKKVYRNGPQLDDLEDIDDFFLTDEQLEELNATDFDEF